MVREASSSCRRWRAAASQRPGEGCEAANGSTGAAPAGNAARVARAADEAAPAAQAPPPGPPYPRAVWAGQGSSRSRTAVWPGSGWHQCVRCSWTRPAAATAKHTILPHVLCLPSGHGHGRALMLQWQYWYRIGGAAVHVALMSRASRQP
jgi:hypothetical protein